MATVNLGSIKFKWKGTYAGGTAYTIDDVVSYNGSSYICIQASTGNLPTDTAYFEQMSSAGTNGTDGTDLTTTLTTQGDIVYRDASGLARLPAGSANQVLQSGGTGANPSWGDVSGGKILQVVQSVKSDTASWSANATTRVATGLSASITPSSTSSKILIQYLVNIGSPGSAVGSQWFLHLFRDSTEINVGDASSSRKRAHNVWGGSYASNQQDYMSHSMSGMFLDSPNTTSSTSYSIRHTDATASGTYYINRSTRDYDSAGYDPRFPSNIILMEVGV